MNNNNKLHQDIKKHLTSYHTALDTFNPIATEFHEFKALDSRKYLEAHISSMSEAELLMLTLIDKLTIKVYEDTKNGAYNEFITIEQLKDEDDFIDLQKAVLIARKNLKDNVLIELATKVQNLNNSDLIFNSCITETL